MSKVFAIVFTACGIFVVAGLGFAATWIVALSAIQAGNQAGALVLALSVVIGLAAVAVAQA